MKRLHSPLTCNDCHFFVKNYSLVAATIIVSQAERTNFKKNQYFAAYSKDFSLKCYHDIWEADVYATSLPSILTKDRTQNCYYFRFTEGMNLETAIKLQGKGRNRADTAVSNGSTHIDRDKSELLINLGVFRKILEREFQLEELKTICFDMHIQFENLSYANNLESLVRELIQYCQRHGRLMELLITTAKARPRNSWDELWS